MSALFWGRSTCDLTYLLEEFPKEDQKSFASNFLLQPGGPALNAAVTYAMHSGSSNLITCIGNNNFGKTIKNILNNYNVDVFDLADENFELPISTVIINSDSNTRTIINSPQDVSKIKSVNQKLYNLIKDSRPEIVQIDGYCLESNIEVLEFIKKNKINIIYDGGSWKSNTHEYIKFVDIAICSSKFRYPDLSLNETIEKMHDLGIKSVAFTNGENPIISSNGLQEKLISVGKIKTVDTLGAGDVFHGAFCFYYSKSGDFELSLKNAASDASNSCRYFGTHTWWENK